MLIFNDLSANLIIKSDFLKNELFIVFFKQKCHILTHNINTRGKSLEIFGLHKLIFVLL